MQRIIAGMRRLAGALGCVVMACVHTGHGTADEDGEVRQPGRMRGTSRFRQAWDFEWMADGARLSCAKNRYGPKFAPVRYAAVASGGSLVISGEPLAVAGQETWEPGWPHPVTEGQLDKVVAAVLQTPGMSMSAVASVAKVRKETTSVALLKAKEAGLVASTGTRTNPKWGPGWAWDGLRYMQQSMS